MPRAVCSRRDGRAALPAALLRIEKGEGNHEDESNAFDSGARAGGDLRRVGGRSPAQAQQVLYHYSAPAPRTVYYSDPVMYQLQYHRVYQGASLHWSPALGFHTHDHYLDVPYWAPTTRVYSQPVLAPTTTTYYAW